MVNSFICGYKPHRCVLFYLKQISLFIISIQICFTNVLILDLHIHITYASELLLPLATIKSYSLFIEWQMIHLKTVIIVDFQEDLRWILTLKSLGMGGIVCPPVAFFTFTQKILSWSCNFLNFPNLFVAMKYCPKSTTKKINAYYFMGFAPLVYANIDILKLEGFNRA